MRKIPYLICFLLGGCAGKWNTPTEQSYLTLPSFSMLLKDSTTTFTSRQIKKGSSTVFIYFSPDCEHCNSETEQILNSINRFMNIDIYFVTPMDFSDMKAFEKAHQLSRYKNITIGNDNKYELYRAFKISSFPYIIIYDKDLHLSKLYKGEIGIDRILAAAKA